PPLPPEHLADVPWPPEWRVAEADRYRGERGEVEWVLLEADAAEPAAAVARVLDLLASAYGEDELRSLTEGRGPAPKAVGQMRAGRVAAVAEGERRDGLTIVRVTIQVDVPPSPATTP
ncbi:MAG: hypothetical protein D6718_02515, partial [Acidobacteria bacterium]